MSSRYNKGSAQRALEQRHRISAAFATVVSSREKRHSSRSVEQKEKTSLQMLIEQVLAALELRHLQQLLAAKRGFCSIRNRVNASASAALNFYERKETRSDQLRARLTLRASHRHVRLISSSGKPVLRREETDVRADPEGHLYILLGCDPASEVDRVLKLAISNDAGLLGGPVPAQIERSMSYKEALTWNPDPSSRAKSAEELETLLTHATESLTALHTAQQRKMETLLQGILNETDGQLKVALPQKLAQLLPSVLAMEPYPDGDNLTMQEQDKDSHELQLRLHGLPFNSSVYRHLLSMHLYFKNEREKLRDRQKEESEFPTIRTFRACLCPTLLCFLLLLCFALRQSPLPLAHTPDHFCLFRSHVLPALLSFALL